MNAAGRVFLFQLRRELRRGILTVQVLQELLDGPTYGYALLLRLRRQAGSLPLIGPSTLYPALARLLRAGLVRSFYGTESQGPIRKYYELTPAGRQLLPTLLELRAGTRGTAGRSGGVRRAVGS